MFVADPRKHLRTATDRRCCRNCDAWNEDPHWETMGDCMRVRWMIQIPVTAVKRKKGDPEFRSVRQVTAPDHVCDKFEANYSPAEFEERAVAAGLG